MPNLDVLCWEDQEGNVYLKATTAQGMRWLDEFDTSVAVATAENFQEFLDFIPREISIGILDPTGKIQKYSPGVLH